jgi:hypothetical protein
MASSVELRVPFLDLINANYVHAARTEQHMPEQTKVTLKNILKDISGIDDEAFYNRPKMGLLHAFSGAAASRRSGASRVLRLATRSPRPYSPYLNGPFQGLWYALIEEIFIRNRSRKPTQDLADIWRDGCFDPV